MSFTQHEPIRPTDLSTDESLKSDLINFIKDVFYEWQKISER